MKLSGRVTVSFNIDPALSRLIAQQYPAAPSAGSFFPLEGQTGQTGRVESGDLTLLARYQHRTNPIPGVDRRREYHILRQLSGTGLAPEVLGYNRQWLLLSWQPGKALNDHQLAAWLSPLTERMAALHALPPSGYRLQFLSLLQQYWQMSRPARRHIGWLRALKRCQRVGEPKPLRLSLLHMDIHAGNIITHQGELHLIDWEYASDGDVALELAAMIAGNNLDDQQQKRLTEEYASLQQIDPGALRQQIRRWRPWLRLLIASWYELRWQQSGETLFYTLAAKAWQRVLSE